MSQIIRLNGVPEPLAPTVAALVERSGVDPAAKGVAVAVNGTVVPRRSWGATPLAEGDTVELIRAVSGG